jgi:hypothetical protein
MPGESASDPAWVPDSLCMEAYLRAKQTAIPDFYVPVRLPYTDLHSEGLSI